MGGRSIVIHWRTTKNVILNPAAQFGGTNITVTLGT